MEIEKPKGTRDFSPRDMEKRRYVEEVIFGVFEGYGYRRIQTPSFEYMDLFQLKSGEEIRGHMYVFEDKKGRLLCLRPEATASVCRMFAETLRSLPKPLKLYYFGSMFRYEEPQRGRYREFWHLGLELIGPSGPEAGAEVISIAYESLKKLGLDFRLEVGHLGVIRGLLDDLGIKEKQDTIIACMDKGDIDGLRELTGEEVLFNLINLEGDNVPDEAGSLLQGYSKSLTALNELRGVTSLLDSLKLDYSLNLGIARGLEYYTGMVFEVRVPGLGAQDQVCGGGRYDNLIELFSGVSMPAVGFAFGFDRVVEAMAVQGIVFPEKRVDVVVAAVSGDVRGAALEIASDLRKDFVVESDLMNRKLGRILEYAGDINAGYVVIVGGRDLRNNRVTVRDMGSGEQDVVEVEKIREVLGK